MHQATKTIVKSITRRPVFFIRTLYCCLFVLLTGCASAPQTQQLLQTSSGLPSHRELTDTPFFPQEQYQCGPAALATVLKHSGVETDASALIDEVYLPSRQGSLQIEILASSRRHNRLPFRIPPEMSALLEEIAAGNPVLVLQNLGLSWAPQWHYAVVVGFDLAHQEIILRSGTEARHRTNMNTSNSPGTQPILGHRGSSCRTITSYGDGRSVFTRRRRFGKHTTLAIGQYRLPYRTDAMAKKFHRTNGTRKQCLSIGGLKRSGAGF